MCLFGCLAIPIRRPAGVVGAKPLGIGNLTCPSQTDFSEEELVNQGGSDPPRGSLPRRVFGELCVTLPACPTANYGLIPRLGRTVPVQTGVTLIRWGLG